MNRGPGRSDCELLFVCGQSWLEFAQREPKSDKGNAIMSTAELLNSFACKTLQAAKEADEPREQFVLLELALEWAAAAKREEAAPPPATQSTPSASN
jgi:hypothetical protein